MNDSEDSFDSQKLFDEAIQLAANGTDLSALTMRNVVCAMMKGGIDDSKSAELLTHLYHKGESVDELFGAALAMREFMTPIRTRHTNVIDTCGTGGGGANLFNISTAVAIVAAASGAIVAKHGNKKSTSKSGSSDVLEVLGVNINASVDKVEECLDQLGICFCFAPLFHPSVKKITNVRRQLNFPTIFNLLGPLCNPAAAPYQLLGVGRGETQNLIANALGRLGTRLAWVVHGQNGLGEVSIADTTAVDIVNSNRVERKTLNPEDFDVRRQSLAPLRVDSPQESARLIQRVLQNESGPHTDIVLINAACAIHIVGLVPDLPSGMTVVRTAIAEGRPRELLERLIKLTNS